MFSQFFGNYLINEGIISPAQLVDAMKEKGDTRLKLEVLAFNEGYMDSEQVEMVRYEQSQADKSFSDIVIEHGYLTAEQVDELLSKQTPDYLILGQALVDAGILTDAKLEEALSAYKEKFAIDASDFMVDKSHKAEKLIHDFFDFTGVENSNYYVKHIDLFLKNLIRFVGDDFTPICAELSDLPNSDNVKNCSLISQDIVGAFSTTSLITGNHEVLAEFSSRYANEDLGEYGELPEAGICDFLNLHNGLYTVNLSQEIGSELSLTPPVADSIKISDISNAFTMQICYPFGSVYFSLTY